MHKFIMENDYQGQLSTKVEFTIPSDADLTDMCEQFTLFLKACGYSIPEGEYLDFTPEDGYSSEGWDSMETATEDFNPRNPIDTAPDIGKKKLWDATPQEWNNAYQNVTVRYREHD
jgi:hypothetical protein